MDIHFGTGRTYLESGTSPENVGEGVGFAYYSAARIFPEPTLGGKNTKSMAQTL